jgi:AcrR family transcriptional regulator
MSPKRIGSDNSATRTAIVDAAEAIMVESGYASVTSRSIATKAGLKSNLLHYYFPTMDELFLCVYRRFAETFAIERQQILQAERPLRHLWELTSDPKNVTIIYEFVALGNHRKEIRAEISRFGNEIRDMNIAAVRAILNRKGFGWIPWLPTVFTIVFESVARNLSLQNALGVTSGRDETLAIAYRIIDLLDS